MIDKLKDIEKRYEALNEMLSDPAVISSPKELQRVSKEHSDLRPVVSKIREYTKALDDLAGAEDVLKSGDSDLKELAREEIDILRPVISALAEELKIMLLPKDKRDERNVIIEIRAGTGGDEAALFAADLFRMYSKYAERNGWKVEVLSSSPTGIGGMKEVIATISGKGVYSRLKYESGVHRVQRVPTTETSGRIHTSAATVAVLPEAEDVDLHIEEKDLRIDTFCASGPGGQGVNTTYSAVRIVHIPTGLIVQCQDERSQIKNKAKALKVLRSRLYDMEIERQNQEIAESRKSQVGSGDRSERIRTYNYPQTRISDHRIGLTLHKLPQFMEGELDEVIDSLTTHFQAEKLKALEHAK